MDQCPRGCFERSDPGQCCLDLFFASWFSPSVDELVSLDKLQKRYKSRGLIILGIHGEQGADELPALLAKQSLSFYIAADGDDTAANFGVDFWPNYFLNDKTGKLSSGYSISKPNTEDIEKLLK